MPESNVHELTRLDKPFRAELLGAERLAESARLLAATHAWLPLKTLEQGPTPLIALVESAAVQLASDNARLSQSAMDQEPVSPGGEWLLDNHYLVEEQIRMVRKDLPPEYGAELPVASEGGHRGFPRIYDAIVTLISHTDSSIDEEHVLRFIDAYQDVSPLTIGEVWAIPIMLRVALIENLRRLSAHVARAHLASRTADRWADTLLITAQETPSALRNLIDEVEQDERASDPAFLMRLAQRLSGQDLNGDAVNSWLSRALDRLGISLDTLSHDQQQEQAANQVSIANAFTAIRFLDAYEWRRFFETCSFVEQILREDPSGVYPRMDFKSRDRLRHSLEGLAQRCPHSEITVAEATIAWSMQAVAKDPDTPIAGHVGYYLIGRGRYELEHSIGYAPHGRERLYRGPLRHRGAFYWGTLVAITTALLAALALVLLALGATGLILLILLLLSLIPFSEVALGMTNRLASRVFPPRILPKLDHRHPIDPAHRTLVVVPALLTSASAAQHVIDNLEIAYLANRDDNISFAVLGDLKGADAADTAADGPIIAGARNGIDRLNDRYESEHGRRPFHLLLRARTYNPVEDSWMGWERKRGALVELNRLITGSAETSFSQHIGEQVFLDSVTFVLTIDADTLLPRDSARQLVSTIAHPLNRARLGQDDARVRAGYGLVQPRVGMSLPASNRSLFAWLSSGVTGIDPYAGAVSDTYQDVFGEGSFTGKGIYEVSVFQSVLEGRFPENTLLSHDLMEGNFLRTALASEIQVYDEHPANYLSHMARLHRWVRGDWQTTPWLFPRIPGRADGWDANPLSALHRWKMIDNLRRSLVAPALLLWMTLGWFLAPGPGWLWPLLFVLIVSFPVYFGFVNALLNKPESVPLSLTLSAAINDASRDVTQISLTVAVLPHQAWMMVDAIFRALWRMLVSRRNLLEWETAADADRRVGNTLRGFTRKMWLPEAVAAASVITCSLTDVDRIPWAFVLAVVWMTGSIAAWQASRVRPVEGESISADETLRLRTLARRTWRYFETFVTAQEHHLPPDNFQEHPGEQIAHRTSPTNIGLHLLSVLNAYDLGYVTVGQLMAQVGDTLHSMAGLERFHGHFFNWYDTRTLQPLAPNYISTVDSGNLAGHLLVLRIGLLEASEAPLLGPQLLDGISDSARLAIEDVLAEEDLDPRPGSDTGRLVESLGELLQAIEALEQPRNLGDWYTLLSGLSALAAAATAEAQPFAAAVPANGESPHPSSGAARIVASVGVVSSHTDEALALLATLAPWAPLLRRAPKCVTSGSHAEALAPLTAYVPSLVGLAEGLDVALATLDEMAKTAEGDESDSSNHAEWATTLAARIRSARPDCVELLARLRLGADITREIWEHTDFRMLFDPHRLLFSIGFNTAEGRLDPSFYDMLASECRLASFLAIAKGDVPQEHWFRLGRPVTQTEGGRALLSWSASMFEYLMPLLVMDRWPQTLLDQTYRTVVRRQIQYGRERGVPWGVSESAFNAKDVDLTYQYQAFGVPGLGLKRGLSDDIVVAPYASLLSLDIDPHSVIANLAALKAHGALGRYGFVESIDYTPGRIPAGAERALVQAYFAHHQGMSFIALGNEFTNGHMRRRFHDDPMVTSAELLLQERVPRGIQLAHPHVEEVQSVHSIRELPPPETRTYPLADTPVPSTHFLSNGSYSVMVTNGGGGYSRWNGLSVSRYREDVTRDCWGQFFYIRDLDSEEFWSATYNPCHVEPDEYHVTFSADKAEFRRHDGDLETYTEVAVSPEDDVEIRRITIVNHGREDRALELTSYFEIALVEQEADQAHKSFSNLFVETETDETTNTVLFSRRPRSDAELRPYGFHTLGCEAAEACEWSFETDRGQFLGRLRQADIPVSLTDVGPLSGTQGPVVDPACAIRRAVSIPAGERARFVFATGVSPDRDGALQLAEKYHDVRSAQRAIDLGWTAAQIELRDLGLSPHEAVVLQRLASRLLLTDPFSMLKVKTPIENGLPISGLWSLGISGDHPILLVRVDEVEHAPLVRQALLAHQYWRHKGLVSDLVILNTRPSAYSDELDDRLRMLVRTGHALQLIDKPGGVFLRRVDQMHPDVLNLLLTVARATLEGDGGPIELQLNRRATRPNDPPPLVPRAAPERFDHRPLKRPELEFDNGLGGFDPQTSEYVIVLTGDQATPAPWVNVMATPEFGCMVSEAGIGCTWAKNSHENRITTWNNDSVSDGSGEALYIRDEDTGRFWSPTPLPVRESEPYVIRHGKGVSSFEHASHGIEQRLDWFVPVNDPVRVCRLRLRNITDHPRKLSVTQFVEWTLGSSRSKSQHLVVSWFDAETDMLTAHNHFNPDFPGRAGFLASNRPTHSWTASRSEFVGRNRHPSDPAAMHRQHLDGRSGRFYDNCGAMMVSVDLEPGEEQDVTFLLGQTDTLDQARQVVERYREPGAVSDALDHVSGYWDEILGSLKVKTPDRALDLMLNGNALYQAVACRLWGRTAAYQSSGAFGFRDQLQDVMCLMLSRPDLVRDQIVEASRHQFASGDVLHWWQPVSGRGVRTRITDDRHWLPFVVAEYISATGDGSVLDERTPFLEGPEVEAGREDNYMQPSVSEHAVSVYEHCCAALDSAAGTGPHGLPLMGGGDWNDGMNRVGIGGTGESIWLGWFLDVVLRRFAEICEGRDDLERAQVYRSQAEKFVSAIETHGWDGAWYRRAYFDDGTPLGSVDCLECQIDAIAQSWATISSSGDPDRATQALDSVSDRLVDPEQGLIRLLSPAFDRMDHDPGYIKGYVPGVRENGGQYTHAALWVVLANLLKGNGDRAHELLRLINPILHGGSSEAIERYRVEPYVVAADVYGVEPHVGRGGWTWYTGSAGWFYRVAVRNMLGLWIEHVNGARHLAIEPCVPQHWPGFSVRYRHHGTTYDISVENPDGVCKGVSRLLLDGKELSDRRIPLTMDEQVHRIRVVLGDD